jgi:hypothetical protein
VYEGANHRLGAAESVIAAAGNGSKKVFPSVSGSY